MENNNIVTRIFIKENGDLIVTDMWEEVKKMLFESEDKESFEQEN